MTPFAYGGPSWSTNLGFPARAPRSFPYRFIAFQRASICGSATGRFAFIGNSVRGRLRVSFQSDIEYSIVLHAMALAGWRYRQWQMADGRDLRFPDFDDEIAAVVGDVVVVDTQEQTAVSRHVQSVGRIANRERLSVAHAADEGAHRSRR